MRPSAGTLKRERSARDVVVNKERVACACDMLGHPGNRGAVLRDIGAAGK
jgi:hypothetical protein